MKLEYWQRNWDQLGRDDPLWVVLTDPTKKGGKWEADEFFETGEREVARVLARAASLKIELGHQRALDFGCGVGRLTQALARRFEEVHGLDISPSMITHARAFAKGLTNCHFHLNANERLDMFEDGTFDFVYSNIALQHIEPSYATAYIREFLRVLRPGGTAVFQLISATFLRRLFPQWFVDRYRRAKHRGQAFIGMFGLPERVVSRIVVERGCRILGLERERSGWRWISLRYWVAKPG